MAEEPDRRRWPWWAAAGILAVYTAFSLVSRLPGIGLGNDDAMYLFLAKSLLQGGYRDIFLPDSPPHLQYPPGWPLLLALPLAVVGDRPELLLFLPLVLSLGGLVLLFHSARRLLPPVPSLCVLAVAAFNPLLITFGGRLKSEAAFFFFAMLALWALGTPEAGRRRLLLGSAAAIASAFMRSAGIAVIGAVFLHFALARRWRWALGFGLAAALTFGPWLGWSFFGPRQVVGRSYVADLVQVEGERVVGARHPLANHAVNAALRLRRYTLGHLHAVMGFKQASGTLADNAGWLLLLATAGAAGAVALWRRFRVALLAIVCLLGLLSLWTWADRRFLHPVVPLVGLVLLAGAHALGSRLGRGGSAAASLVVLALLTPGTWWRTRDLISRGWACTMSRSPEACYTPAERSFLAASLAARALPDTAVVLTNREAAFAYHSGRRAVFASEAGGARGAEFLAFARDRGITHVLLSRIAGGGPVDQAAPLADDCRRLEALGEFGQATVLFRLLPADREVTGPDPTCALAARLYDEARAIHEEEQRNIDRFELGDPEER